MTHGFISVAAAVPSVRVADTEYNVTEIERLISEAEEKGAELVVFPELSITAYTCQDLFRQQLLLERAEQALISLLQFTRKLDVIAVVGLPVRVGSQLYNCAAVVQRGTLLGVVPKTCLPNYGEFYEKRWFASAADLLPQETYLAGSPVTLSPQPMLFQTAQGVRFGIEICEDLWAPLPPSGSLALAGADIILNLSASDELIGKHSYLLSLIASQSARSICGYVYSSCGFGESTQDVVFGGNALVYENGRQLTCGPRFSLQPQLQIAQIDIDRLRAERQNNTTFRSAQTTVRTAPCIVACRPTAQRDTPFTRIVPRHPFIPSTEQQRAATCEEILNIQVAGLAKRLTHTHSQKAVIGISGGLDSTLALLVAVRAFDSLGISRTGIIGITMPGFGTTRRTHDNATELMTALGITQREISIAKATAQHFADIGHNPDIHDVTYENSQARERTQVLMDVANQEGALVIGTGDLSELALGWCTYNGDHMSMYSVNAGVPKTLVKYLISYVAALPAFHSVSETLTDIVETPISPELTPADSSGNIQQKTEDLVGPYELHDFFLYYFLRHGFSPSKIFFLAQHAFASRYDEATLRHWLQTFCCRFFSQQFKRSCLPDGPKVGSVSLSPRGDWRMPSDASAALWLQDCQTL